MSFYRCFEKYLHVYFQRARKIIYQSHVSRYHHFMMYRYLLVFAVLVAPTALAYSSSDSLIYSFSFSDTTKYDQGLTVDVDLKAEPGKIILASGATKNLALGSRMRAIYAGTYPKDNQNKPDTTRMNADKLHDGNYFTIVNFPANDNVNSVIKINLQVVRRVNKITVVTLGNLSNSYNLRPQAFSYYGGLDSNRMTKIFQEFDNIDSARHTAFITDPQPIQYINFVLDKQHPTQSTVISEFEIFGEGYVTEGYYVSKVDSTGTLPANFATFYVDAEIPNGTQVAFQFRSGYTKTFDSLQWSDWSAPVVFNSTAEAQRGGQIITAEPRKYFQYRLRLFTSGLETPKVQSVKMVYQHNLVADSTSASIAPDTVEVLSPVTLNYSIVTKMSASSLGIDTIKILTPSPSVVRAVRVNGVAVAYNFIPSPDAMIIAFPTTIASTSTIDVTFSTKMIAGGEFPAQIISKASPWNPQIVDPKRTSAGNAWKVSTTGIPAFPLVDVRVDPNPFTPNNDGRNDATIIDFSVSNLSVAKPLKIHVFDLSGRRIRTIVETMTGSTPYFGDPRTGGKGFLWDGRDDEGKRVRPGVYIIQVSLDVDNGGQVVTKSVVVAY